MKPKAIQLLFPLLLASTLPAFAQPARAPVNPVQRELIYCADQMSHEEREAYRVKMQSAKTPQDKETVRSQHRLEMQERARAAGREGVCEPPRQPGIGQGYQGGTAK